jgi:hypothetical protein
LESHEWGWIVPVQDRSRAGGPRGAARISRRAALAGAATLAASAAVVAVPLGADSATPQDRGRQALLFALLLEQLQAAFYARALQRGALQGELRQLVEVVGGHEKAHVAFLSAQLGSAARPAPAFALDEVTANQKQVLATAVALEDLAVAGYNGQVVGLRGDALASLARISSVEARHAGWARDLAGLDPAPKATDTLSTTKQVLAGLRSTGVLA